MQKIVAGRIYNTDTATEIANFVVGYDTGDFGYVDETLYKTRKGAFFLAGTTGAYGRFARQAYPGSGISAGC